MHTSEKDSGAIVLDDLLFPAFKIANRSDFADFSFLFGLG